MAVATMRHVRRPSATLVAAVVLVASFGALSATRASHRPLPSRTAALRAVLRDPRAARLLAHGERWRSLRVSPVDAGTARVTFFDGPRVVMEVALTPRRRVARLVDFRQLRTPYGAPLSHRGWLIALGCVAFALATAVVPLRRVRNGDVVALLALVVPLALLDARYAAASTLAAVPSLVWLIARCAWAGLGPSRPAPPSRALLLALTPSWPDAQRVRLLRLAVVVAALAVAMMTLSAPFTVDVGQAVMEGGTLLLHGVLPYGHLPGDVFHGDTYPLLSYLAYAPLAALMPVHDDWDVANGALVVAAASALAVAWMLGRGTRPRGLRAPAHRWERVAGEEDAAPQGPDATAGLRSALAWLVYPPLVVTVSSGTSDVLLAVLLAAALVAVRRPLASVALVVLAGWFKLVPFALLPIWLARLRGRALVVALALLAASALATGALLLALGGAAAPARMLHALAFQFERRTLHSAWTLLGIEWLQPLVQAGVLALVAGAAVRVRREPALAADPARLAALAGAVLLGLQLAGYYWTYLYLAWAMPCIVLGLLGPASPPASALRRRIPVREPVAHPVLV
jgi:hypothetical protein